MRQFLPLSLKGQLRPGPTARRADDNTSPVRTESQEDGSFVLDLPGGPWAADLFVEIERRHSRLREVALEPEQIADPSAGHSVRLPDVQMARRITAGFWVAALAFVAVLAIIALERLHNTMAALLGMAVLLGTSFVGGAVNPNLFIFDFERALEEYVNFDVIFLVMGMMIVVGVIEETGIFQWLAYQAYPSRVAGPGCCSSSSWSSRPSRHWPRRCWTT